MRGNLGILKVVLLTLIGLYLKGFWIGRDGILVFAIKKGGSEEPP